MKTKPKKIYQYEPTCPYSWGCILIAAHSREDADKILLKGPHGLGDSYLKIKFIEEVPKLKYFGKAGVVLNNARCE